MDFSSLNIIEPSEADLTDEFIFITDHSHYVIKMFSMEGCLLKGFEMNEAYGSVNGVIPFERELYVVQTKALTVLSLQDMSLERKRRVFMTNVESVSVIAFVDPTEVLILEHISGSVSKFDSRSVKNEQVCCDLEEPNSMDLVQNCIAVLDYATNKVNIYNTTFKTVGVVNGDKNFNPRGTTILQSGNVLVSSNEAHTICEYDQTGMHIQCVLTEKDGIKYPHVIKYKYEKLLVTERIWDDPEDTHVGIKLFSLT